MGRKKLTEEERKARKKKYERKRYLVNREKILEKQRIAYQNNPKKFLDKIRKYKHAHPDRRRESLRKYRLKNLNKVLKAHRRYKIANPEKIKAQQERRLDRLQNASGPNFFSVSAQTLYAQRVLLYGGLCFYCRKNPAEHLDHLRPISRPQTSNFPCNIVGACKRCNLSKGPKIYPLEWSGPPED